MFSLWYFVLGAKEYSNGTFHFCSPNTSSTPPSSQAKQAPKPEPVTKPTEPINIVKPGDRTPDPVVTKPKTPEPVRPQPKAPETPVQKPAESPKAVIPESPKVAPEFKPEPVTPKVAPVTPKVPESPKPDITLAPESPKVPVRAPDFKPQPATPESPKPRPVQPSPGKETPPRAQEPSSPVKPPRTPEFPQTQQWNRNSPKSREDELFANSKNFGRPEQNGSKNGVSPRDLSYGSYEASPKIKDKSAISNPDSLESSDAED